MPIAADYPFLDIVWTMIIFFTWVVWVWMMILILSDVFRRRDISGWRKASWVVLLLVLPFIGVLAYLISHPNRSPTAAGPSVGSRRDPDPRREPDRAPGDRHDPADCGQYRDLLRHPVSEARRCKRR